MDVEAKAGCGLADEVAMPTSAAHVTLVALGLALTMFVAACGSSSGSPSSTHSAQVSATQKAQDKVIAMVLTDGDLLGFSLQSDAAEKRQRWRCDVSGVSADAKSQEQLRAGLQKQSQGGGGAVST